MKKPFVSNIVLIFDKKLIKKELGIILFMQSYHLSDHRATERTLAVFVERQLGWSFVQSLECSSVCA